MCNNEGPVVISSPRKHHAVEDLSEYSLQCSHLTDQLPGLRLYDALIRLSCYWRLPAASH